MLRIVSVARHRLPPVTDKSIENTDANTRAVFGHFGSQACHQSVAHNYDSRWRTPW